MTREEAIAVLEESKRQNEVMRDNPTTFWASHQMAEGVRNSGKRIVAIDMALSALTPPTQEQLERVCRAEWIKKHRHCGGFRRYTGTDDMGEVHTITVDERAEYDDLYCSKCGKQSADNFLKFCPNCGRAMTTAAWEEQRKRWEALNDGKG